MARLFHDLVVNFVGPPLSREGQQEMRLILREARQAARRSMVRVRRIVRQAAPRRSGKMARSLNVRNTRAPRRNAVSVRLETGQRAFYSAPTNSGPNTGGNAGWWDRSVATAVREVYAGPLGFRLNGLGRRYAALIARDLIKRFVGRLVTGTIRILGASIRPVPAGQGSRLSFNFG